jgi:diguanylate cyclase (GGDEF)-like protein
MNGARAQKPVARTRADEAVERAIEQLETLLAMHGEESKGREALETLRRAWSSARVGAQTDPLTELPNRAWFRQALEDTLARAARSNTTIALLFLDLDGFKDVNDSCGHHAGDQLLAAVAKRVLSSVRDDDLVARFGGDEFVVLLENLEAPHIACQIAGRVVDAVSTDYSVEGTTFSLSVSVGIALYPQHAQSAGELLRHADLAMYRAKHQGGRRYEVFEHENGRASQSGISRNPFAAMESREPLLEALGTNGVLSAKGQSSGS